MAWRAEGDTGAWTDERLSGSFDYLFDWKPEPLPVPWALVPLDQRAALEVELHAEVAAGHPLFGSQVIAIARCERCDEVLFAVETDALRFVRVHLTWRRAVEQPPSPWTEYVAMPLSRDLRKHGH